MRKTEAITKFKKLFEQFAHTQSYHNAFTEFLDTALLLLKMRGIWDEEDIRVAERLESGRDGEKYGAIVGEMIITYSEIADNEGAGFYDGLGDLFMELISHGHNGQFFTPQEVCDMMAQMTYGDMGAAEGEVKSVCDPACGSGRTLLSAAKLNRRNKFYGADIDHTCVKMTVLNMLMNSMEGEVAWMDTLAMKHWKSYHIKKIMDNTGHWVPYYYTTGPNNTNFIERLPKSAPEKVEVKAQEPPVTGKAQQLSMF